MGFAQGSGLADPEVDASLMGPQLNARRSADNQRAAGALEADMAALCSRALTGHASAPGSTSGFLAAYLYRGWSVHGERP